MVTIIDDEFINGIKMCNQVEFLFEEKLISCTFNFNIDNKWIEFYVTLRQKIHQLNTLLIVLNGKIRNLRQKEWSKFHKIHETKWLDDKFKPLYSYRIRTSKIIEQIVKEIDLLWKEESVELPKPTIGAAPTIHPRDRLKQKVSFTCT